SVSEVERVPPAGGYQGALQQPAVWGGGQINAGPGTPGRGDHVEHNGGAGRGEEGADGVADALGSQLCRIRSAVVSHPLAQVLGLAGKGCPRHPIGVLEPEPIDAGPGRLLFERQLPGAIEPDRLGLLPGDGELSDDLSLPDAGFPQSGSLPDGGPRISLGLSSA